MGRELETHKVHVNVITRCPKLTFVKMSPLILCHFWQLLPSLKTLGNIHNVLRAKPHKENYLVMKGLWKMLQLQIFPRGFEWLNFYQAFPKDPFHSYRRESSSVKPVLGIKSTKKYANVELLPFFFLKVHSQPKHKSTSRGSTSAKTGKLTENF